jgi:hypothetical protein
MIYLRKTADISECEKYRYMLTRTWNEHRPSCTFIGLNPSTADANADDATIRRCVAFADAWGCGTLMMVNLWPYRATDPRELRGLVLPPSVMERNEDAILKAMLFSKHSIAAWGNHGAKDGRGPAVISKYCRGLSYLRLSMGGHPAHPLYLPAYLKPVPFTDQEL